MTYHRNSRNVFFVPLILITILACNIGSGNTQPKPSSSPTTEPSVNQLATVPVVINTPELVTVTEQLSIANGNQIVPVTFPIARSGSAGDFDSSTVLANKSLIGGDRFTFGRFERPFNANTMDTYFPYLDIVDTSVYQDNTWIFARIVLHGPDTNNQFPGRYAVELDTNLDGNGDWLIIASNPNSTDWVTTGVQIYQDTDSSVGGTSPTVTDKQASNGNGYETLIFDQGKGDDPESAWVRLAPASPNTVEFAIKRSIFKTVDLKYMIDMWAGNSLLDPALFDLNDHFTHVEAGASDKGLTNYYPIKAVSEIDNSCRMAVGFKPTGSEPGLCNQPSTVAGSDGVPGVSGCTAPQSEIDKCNATVDYSWNSSTCSCNYSGPK